MICFATRDVWTAASIDVKVVTTTHTWVCGAAVNNAHDAVNDFASWLGSAFSAVTFTPAYSRDTATSGLVLAWTFATSSSVVTELTPNTVATTLLGFVAIIGPSTRSVTFIAPAPAAGTWAPAQTGGLVSQSLDYSLLAGRGDCGGAGAIRRGVPGLGDIKPAFNAMGTPQDAARLAAVTAQLPTLRTGWTYRRLDSTWHFLNFGAVSRVAAGRSLYHFEFDVGA